jgi:hypothetical protein
MEQESACSPSARGRLQVPVFGSDGRLTTEAADSALADVEAAGASEGAPRLRRRASLQDYLDARRARIA